MVCRNIKMLATKIIMTFFLGKGSSCRIPFNMLMKNQKHIAIKAMVSRLYRKKTMETKRTNVYFASQ